VNRTVCGLQGWAGGGVEWPLYLSPGVDFATQIFSLVAESKKTRELTHTDFSKRFGKSRKYRCNEKSVSYQFKFLVK